MTHKYFTTPGVIGLLLLKVSRPYNATTHNEGSCLKVWKNVIVCTLLAFFVILGYVDGFNRDRSQFKGKIVVITWSMTMTRK